MQHQQQDDDNDVMAGSPPADDSRVADLVEESGGRLEEPRPPLDTSLEASIDRAIRNENGANMRRLAREIERDEPPMDPTAANLLMKRLQLDVDSRVLLINALAGAWARGQA
jgi:hypothetical protein